MSDNENTTSIKDAAANDRPRREIDCESIAEDLDPRIKEADSCYIHVVEYDASLFALEQCRTVCNRLEENLIKNNSRSDRDLDVCVENLHQMNEANDKLDYWSKKLTDEEHTRNEALGKLQVVYNSCASTIKRYKPYANPGMLYYRQQLFFYKCIHAVINYIDKLERCVLQLNESYNDLLIATNQLTFELQNKDDFQMPDVTSMVLQNYIECSKRHDLYMGDGRVLVDKIFSIIFQMNYICTSPTACDSPTLTTLHNSSFQRSRMNSDSSYTQNVNTTTVDSLTPPSNLSNGNSPRLSNSTCEKSIDKHTVCAAIGKLHLSNGEHEFDGFCNNKSNSDQKIDNILVGERHMAADISLTSTTTRTSVSTSTTKQECSDKIADNNKSTNESDVGDAARDQPRALELNNATGLLFGYSTITSTPLSVKRAKQTTLSFMRQTGLSPSHKKTKSDFTYNKQIINEIPSTRNLFGASSESIIGEENTGDLTVCIADINSSKLNMDLSLYNMNSSFINNIHLYIALSLNKYDNLPNIPKIGCTKSFIFKSFF